MYDGLNDNSKIILCEVIYLPSRTDSSMPSVISKQTYYLYNNKYDVWLRKKKEKKIEQQEKISSNKNRLNL